ncbi:hypothetical protein Tco_1051532 [Tanacetum coccineum]
MRSKRRLIRIRRLYLAALLKLSFDEERFLKQKSKIEWLRVGDTDSAYFHRSVKARSSRSRIDCITGHVLLEGFPGSHIDHTSIMFNHHHTRKRTGTGTRRINIQNAETDLVFFLIVVSESYNRCFKSLSYGSEESFGMDVDIMGRWSNCSHALTVEYFAFLLLVVTGECFTSLKLKSTFNLRATAVLILNTPD